jgi:hemerythrin superfamily protein
MSEDTRERVDDLPEHAEDVVELLVGQHMLIRDLFVEVQTTTGERRGEAFARLVHLLAVHETAEEEVVHPLARREIDGGEQLVEDRLHEEREAKEALVRLEGMDLGSEEFATAFALLRSAVLEHAHYEEAYEFPHLRARYEPDRLGKLAERVRMAEKAAPTRPHPGNETAVKNLTVGPVLAVFDRVKDAMRDG